MKDDAHAVLPPGVYKRRASYFYVTTVDGKQKWINLGKNKSFALSKYADYIRQNKSESYIQRRLHKGAEGYVPAIELAVLIRKARSNAKARGLEFNITIDDLKEVSKRCRGKCELTDIKFRYGADLDLPAGARRKRLWAPSIDRINSRLGYTPENIRLVCFAVNAALQEFGDEVLLKIAAALSKKRK